MKFRNPLTKKRRPAPHSAAKILHTNQTKSRRIFNWVCGIAAFVGVTCILLVAMWGGGGETRHPPFCSIMTKKVIRNNCESSPSLDAVDIFLQIRFISICNGEVIAIFYRFYPWRKNRETFFATDFLAILVNYTWSLYRRVLSLTIRLQMCFQLSDKRNSLET